MQAGRSDKLECLRGCSDGQLCGQRGLGRGVHGHLQLYGVCAVFQGRLAAQALRHEAGGFSADGYAGPRRGGRSMANAVPGGRHAVL